MKTLDMHERDIKRIQEMDKATRKFAKANKVYLKALEEFKKAQMEHLATA